jgi:hypothetical protein
MYGVSFVIGILVGAILLYIFVERKKPSGTFTIDFSDPAKDVCRLDLEEDLNDIWSKKHIVLKVVTRNADSQK